MVIVAIGFCVRCTHRGVRFELLVGSYDVWDNSTTHHLLCERKDQNGKSGFGAARSTAAMGSSTTLSTEFHRGYTACAGLDLSREENSTDLHNTQHLL